MYVDTAKTTLFHCGMYIPLCMVPTFLDRRISLTFPVFFAFFQYFFINFSSIFHIFPVFFHQLFQYFPHFSSVFFISFSKCSQTCLICALLIHHFCLIHQGSLKTLKVLSLMPMLSYPLNSLPRLVHCKIFTYFSNELSRCNCICFLCSSNFHKFFQYLFYSIFSGFIFKEWPPLTIGSLYYKQMPPYYTTYPWPKKIGHGFGVPTYPYPSPQAR